MSTPIPAADSAGTTHGGTLSSPAARRGFLLVLLTGITWGTAGVSGSLVTSRTDLGPLDIAWYRMAIAAAALLAGHLATQRRRSVNAIAPVLGRGVVVRLALVGLGLAAYQLAYFAAVARAGVSIATLVALGLAPLLVAVGSTVLGHGRPDGTTVAALVVALVGLVLLVGISAGADTGTSVLLGALLAAGSGLGYRPAPGSATRS
jgi:DME family drug/metabolite transporter